MVLKGSGNRVVSYEWNEDYEDFVNRFEQWIDMKTLKIGNVDELYDALHDWLGITKRGKLLPTQPQMDLFSEYYGVDNFTVSEYMHEVYAKEQAEAPQFGYKQGTIYNEGTHEVEYRNVRTNKYEHYMGEEATFTIRNKQITVIRDSKTKKILAWHKDVTNDKYFGQTL